MGFKNELGSIAKANFLYRIGRCPKCMRESFLAMIVSWGIFVSIFFMPHIGIELAPQVSNVLAAGAALMAASLSSLWVLHISTYTFRVHWSSIESDYKKLASGSTHSRGFSVQKRRFLIATIYSFDATATLVAVFTAFPKRSNAQTSPVCC